jgi:hypothetical protein
MADPQLTPVLSMTTSVPAPVSILQPNGSITKQASTDATVSLKICSEFTPQTVPANALGGVSQLGLVHGKDGQPIIFSIGNNKVG